VTCADLSNRVRTSANSMMSATDITFYEPAAADTKKRLEPVSPSRK
jgi:hypothetical protein